MARVLFETPGRMNLLGYFLRSLIERNLKSENGRRALSKIKGTLLVGASEMRVTLRFTQQEVVIALDEPGPVDARVCGTLDALLAVALGRELVAPVLSGRLKVGGKIWRLLPLLTLLRTEPQR
jgi:ubiquinone biosynthesis protein UbiJ